MTNFRFLENDGRKADAVRLTDWVVAVPLVAFARKIIARTGSNANRIHWERGHLKIISKNIFRFVLISLILNNLSGTKKSEVVPCY